MSEDVGRTLAPLFAPEAEAAIRVREKQRKRAVILVSLCGGVLEAVESLNETLGIDLFRFEESKEGFSLTFPGQPTLNVEVGLGTVALASPTVKSHDGKPAFDVLEKHGAFEFQAVSPNPTSASPSLTQDQFIELLLKLSGGKEVGE